MNGARPSKRATEIQLPWPPGNLGHSNHPVGNRDQVMQVLTGLREEMLRLKHPVESVVWAVRRNPWGELHVYFFHPGCVPYSPTEPWVLRPLNEDPPPDDAWEVKFLELVGAQEAPPEPEPSKTLQ